MAANPRTCSTAQTKEHNGYKRAQPNRRGAASDSRGRRARGATPCLWLRRAPPAGLARLRIFTGDNPNFLTFHSANCSVGKKNGLQAVAHLNGWRLLVGIRPFTGFHRYALVRGRFNGTFLDLSAPNGAGEYASDFVPPHHIPSGGEINFSDHGSLMGGGFYPMFNQAGTDAVVSRAVSSATIRRKSTDAEAFPGAGARSERPLTRQRRERRSATWVCQREPGAEPLNVPTASRAMAVAATALPRSVQVDMPPA